MYTSIILGKKKKNGTVVTSGLRLRKQQNVLMVIEVLKIGSSSNAETWKRYNNPLVFYSYSAKVKAKHKHQQTVLMWCKSEKQSQLDIATYKGKEMPKLFKNVHCLALGQNANQIYLFGLNFLQRLVVKWAYFFKPEILG